MNAPLSVLILRGSSAAVGGSTGELGIVVRQAKLMASLLSSHGVNATFMDDMDVHAGIPSGVKTVVLPYNPVMPRQTETALLQFHAGGGGLVGFYDISEALQQVTGIHKRGYLPASRVDGGLEGIEIYGGKLTGAPNRIRQTSWNTHVLTPAGSGVQTAAVWTNEQGATTGYPAVLTGPRAAWMAHILRNEDPAAGGRLLLAMVGHTWPDVWRAALGRQIEDLGRNIHPSGFQAAVQWMDGVALGRGLTPARNQITLARRSFGRARSLYANGDYVASTQSLRSARSAMLEAFYLIQPSADEFRGAWCHRGYGVAGWSWEETARQLKATGFTAVFPNISNASEGWYSTRLLDPPPGVPEGRDYLAECLRASRAQGLECHAWMVCFKIDDNVSENRLADFRRRGLLVKGADGSLNEKWLCPSHPVNRRKIMGVASEILSRYSVDGLHLDYIRFPGSEYCYCPQCRRAFERSVGAPVKNWPRDVRGGSQRQQWQDFRVSPDHFICQRHCHSP
jgi:uncharacterized protein YfiM (DUF2279 family)